MSGTEARDFLLRSLRDLDAEREAGDIDQRDYDALRADYTARAAAAARGTTASPEPGRRRAGIAAVIVAFAVVAGLLVARTSGDRLPGDQATGSVTPASPDRLARARQLVSEGKAVEAVKLYDQVLEDEPNQPEALTYRGWLLRLAGLTDDALGYIDRAIAADPSFPDAHFFRARILWKDRKDLAGAAAELRLVLANDPPAELRALAAADLEQVTAEARP